MSRYNNFRTRMSDRVASWLLKVFAPEYLRFISGAVEYGLRASARDAAAGVTELPPDWRVKHEA